MNTQIPIPQRMLNPHLLVVVDVWHTLQGEGPFSGERAYFVRLAGCNLQCPLCDTDYTSNTRTMTPHQLVTQLREMKKVNDARLLVITGGEPLRWNLNDFLRMASETFPVIQIETNGTYSVTGLLDHWVGWNAITVVCSPKTPNIHPTVINRMDALKYVIEAGQIDERGFPVSALGNAGVWSPDDQWLEQWRRYRRVEIYNSPCDTKDPVQNDANYRAAAENCLKHGFRLSLQVHKLCGLD